MATDHLMRTELEAGLDEIRRSPADDGRVVLIVRRPAEDVREQLETAELDPAQGLVGDTWAIRGSSSTPDGSANRDAQLTVMNARVVELLAGQPDRRQLAGDQLYVDLDLSEANLPPRTRLAVGTALIEITDKPHTGCAKFAARFGAESVRFVNSPVGRRLRLRGVNARVVVAGTVSTGDVVRKVEMQLDDPGAPRQDPSDEHPADRDLRVGDGVARVPRVRRS